MKINAQFLMIVYGLFISSCACAQDRIYSNEFDRCTKGAVNADENFDCTSSEISFQKKRLNTAYAKLIKKLDASDKSTLDKVQREWITWRDDNYNFLSEHVRGEYSTTRATSLDFLLKSIFDRASEIEMILDEMGENSSPIK